MLNPNVHVGKHSTAKCGNHNAMKSERETRENHEI